PVAVIAPPPDVSALSRPRTMTALRTSVIEPPPSVHQSVREIGDISIGHLQVVAPAPQMPMQAQSSIWATMKSRLGIGQTSVVAPPPSVNGIGNRARQGMGSVSPGTRVVPPPPGVHRVGDLPVGTGYSTAMAVVPPAASVHGFEGSGGQRVHSLPAVAMQVSPPPLAVQNSNESGRSVGSMAAGTPPPSVLSPM